MCLWCIIVNILQIFHQSKYLTTKGLFPPFLLTTYLYIKVVIFYFFNTSRESFITFIRILMTWYVNLYPFCYLKCYTQIMVLFYFTSHHLVRVLSYFLPLRGEDYWCLRRPTPRCLQGRVTCPSNFRHRKLVPVVDTRRKSARGLDGEKTLKIYCVDDFVSKWEGRRLD